jgi:RAB protein geranylgeranyltransferase component A
MYKDLNNAKYDYFIIGTSLTESILSSYLAKSGKKILHIDVSKCYGGDCKNLNFRDLENCILF